jgi:hypothetical protein
VLAKGKQFLLLDFTIVIWLVLIVFSWHNPQQEMHICYLRLAVKRCHISSYSYCLNMFMTQPLFCLHIKLLKRENKCLQSRKTKRRATPDLQNKGGELGCSRRVSSSCSTCITRLIIHVCGLVIKIVIIMHTTRFWNSLNKEHNHSVFRALTWFIKYLCY